jgi:hypothetical protein
VPDELLTISGEDYSSLVGGLETIKTCKRLSEFHTPAGNGWNSPVKPGGHRLREPHRHSRTLVMPCGRGFTGHVLSGRIGSRPAHCRNHYMNHYAKAFAPKNLCNENNHAAGTWSESFRPHLKESSYAARVRRAAAALPSCVTKLTAPHSNRRRERNVG